MFTEYQSSSSEKSFSTLDFGAKTSDKPDDATSTSASTSTSTLTSNSPPSSQPSTASNSGASTPSSSTYTQTDKGIHYMDEGEKDKNGTVMTATKEPCEDCGGKIVWATKGPWLMVCQGCGEPQ